MRGSLTRSIKIGEAIVRERLGREHSFVWRVKQGERRLDLVEFHWYCAALGCDEKSIYGLLAERFEEADRRNPGTLKGQ
jgi:hypothetical protein